MVSESIVKANVQNHQSYWAPGHAIVDGIVAGVPKAGREEEPSRERQSGAQSALTCHAYPISDRAIQARAISNQPGEDHAAKSPRFDAQQVVLAPNAKVDGGGAPALAHATPVGLTSVHIPADTQLDPEWTPCRGPSPQGKRRP